MNGHVLIACVPYLAGIVLCVAALRWVLVCSLTCPQWSQWRQLHRDERGAVQSLSFVLTLPLFVMILLFILQLSQLTVARLVVEYSAFAAARSAVVWIPATLGDGWETENRISLRTPLEDYTDERGNLFHTYRIEPGGPKFEKIHFAAAMNLLSIAPSRTTEFALDADGSNAALALEHAYAALAPATAGNTRIPARLRNKLAYALANTQVELEIRHRDTEPALDPPHVVWDSGREFEVNEIGWQDQVLVTVRHEFALLPGPGRFLSRPTSTSSGDRVAARIRQRQGLFVYPLSATVRLNNEGEKSVLPYVQSLDGIGAPDRPPDVHTSEEEPYAPRT